MVRTGLALVLGVVAGTAAYTNPISATNPESLFNHINNAGLVARLDTDDFGDPHIRVHHQGAKFSVFFYDCQDGINCRAIQFYAGYRLDGSWTKDQANTWNQKRRFTKAYVSDDGIARLEMDVYTGIAGIHSTDFAAIFDRWIQTMSEFEELIEW